MSISHRPQDAGYIFVYGTLRTDISRPVHSDLLAETTDDVQKGSVQAALYDIGEYPGLVPSPDPADRVMGEVFHIKPGASAQLLKQLDRYEGLRSATDIRGQYRREICAITCGENVVSRLGLHLQLANRQSREDCQRRLPAISAQQIP